MSSSTSSPSFSSSSSAVPATSTAPQELLLSTPERPLILAFNLSAHELDALRSTGLWWNVVAVGGEEVGGGSLLDVAAGSVTLAKGNETESAPPPPRPAPSLSVRATLLVLPKGCSANDGASQGLAAYPAAVDEALAEAGCALCVTGGGVASFEEEEKNGEKKEPQQQLLLSDALERLGRAHAAASGIWRPLPWLQEEEKVPRGATLAMAAFLDAAPWGDSDDNGTDSGDENEGKNDGGEDHLDLSGLAVVDGLLSPQEASDLLVYLTDGDPSSPVEGEKWQRGAVVDYDGGEKIDDGASTSSSPSISSPPSWGATPQFIDSLLSDPPPQLLAICSRLRALYSEQFAEILLCPDNDEMSPGLTPLVLNAITAEDAPLLSPHVDADPLRSDPDGAWARAFGLYRNRSSTRNEGGNERRTFPLLATALLYLQDWPFEDAAETLFFDAEEVGLGLAVRPQAGRVVISEQDVLHRIVPPRARRSRRRSSGSRSGARAEEEEEEKEEEEEEKEEEEEEEKDSGSSSPSPPRYSLVLKLALIPKTGERKGGRRIPTSVVLPAWRPGALRLGTAARSGWPLPLSSRRRGRGACLLRQRRFSFHSTFAFSTANGEKTNSNVFLLSFCFPLFFASDFYPRVLSSPHSTLLSIWSDRRYVLVSCSDEEGMKRRRSETTFEFDSLA